MKDDRKNVLLVHFYLQLQHFPGKAEHNCEANHAYRLQIRYSNLRLLEYENRSANLSRMTTFDVWFSYSRNIVLHVRISVDFNTFRKTLEQYF
jgi:hypothetical protein